MRKIICIRKVNKSNKVTLFTLAVVYSNDNASPSLKPLNDLGKVHEALHILLAAASTTTLVAVASGEVIAVMVLAFILSLIPAGRYVAFIVLLVIDEKFRRRGIATDLIERVIHIGKEKVLIRFCL